MTKYVISGYIGFDNFGDEAIASVLTSYLKSINAEKITVLSSNPTKTANLYGVESVNYLKFYQPIFKSDVLISGGGSLLQDVTSLKSLIYYLTVIVTALVLGKKVIIFAQGFTPFRTKFGKFFTGFVLKYCDKIYVRDLKSQEILSQMGIKSELMADPVFGIDTPKTVEHKGVGVQLRDFNTLTDEFLQKLADKISVEFPNDKIQLFSLQDSIDLPVLERFSDMLKEKGILSEIHQSLSIEEGIQKLSGLEYLIGMRFHANLVAAKARVKVLGINYDIKVLNLAKNVCFPIIGLNDNNFDNEFAELKNINPLNYSLPEFSFPKL